MAQPDMTETQSLRLIEGSASSSRLTTEIPFNASPLLASLPMRLQTTLDWTALLTILRDTCQQVFGLCVVNYQHDHLLIHSHKGKTLAHQCQYQLEINKENLGQLSLSRDKRFSEAEILLFEDMLCKFVYPLRNCLLYREAVHSARTDKVTGLPNRIAFETSLKREIALSQRLETPLCLLIIDVDHFKAINDEYGHQIGDKALRHVAETLTNSLRRTDIIFRYGGEEFVALLSQCRLSCAKQVAERLRQDIEQSDRYQSKHGALTVSIGLSQFDIEEDVQAFFKRTDQALYQAKANGRNQIVAAE